MPAAAGRWALAFFKQPMLKAQEDFAEA